MLKIFKVQKTLQEAILWSMICISISALPESFWLGLFQIGIWIRVLQLIVRSK